ncbi:hypothetical protein PoB_001633300 [Plakobranchus ocellatus]|uniref:Uncharacterized protein n=1 Tax=Plakobranchus ocellatus TaxID=259542 RepID=A0AAV3Z5T9_9GAST|nr:hypothetical protein PoB_001633300 [Plakobranchus ocellatus]
MPQPRKLLTLSDTRSFCNAAPPGSGVRRSYLMMNDSPIFMKPTRRVIIYKVCPGVTLYKSFVQERNTRSSWRTERDTVGPRLLLLSLRGTGRDSSACFIRMPV